MDGVEAVRTGRVDAADLTWPQAALLAAAHRPEPAPVATVSYRSGGRLLIIGALDAAERIRQQVAASPFRWELAHVVVTVSVGVAQVHMGQTAMDSLIQESEAALKIAKQAGRNCVRASSIVPRNSNGESTPVTRP